MISIICVCNNRRMYNTYLLPSLNKQRNCSYEIIRIDNSENRYKSAIEAFNAALNEAKGEYIFFVHQDIELTDELFINKVDNYFKNNPNTGIVGVAGTKDGIVYSNIYQSLPKTLVSDHHLEEPVLVNSLDECLFVIPRQILNDYPFDNDTCDHWHLYAVDYCYQMLQVGKDVVVLPLDAYHASYGDFMNDGYYYTLKKVAKKYQSKTKKIDTTIRSWSTNPVLLDLNIRYLKYKKKRMLNQK